MNWKALSASLVPIAAVFAFWPQFEPALDWFVRTSMLILDRPTVQAVLVAMSIGVLLAGWLPHFLPDWLAPSLTKSLTRFLCAFLTFTACYVLLNPHGAEQQAYALVYCVLACLASAQVWTTASGLLYRVTAKPESLK